MSTFLLRLDPPPGPGPRLAVKDIIDVEGTPTTSASRPLAATARPAAADAACVTSARAAGARIVGKTNLHELAFGGTGVNPYTGTPVNPLDPARIPGGSSSGSAVAVATGEADVGFGTDTGGSIRTPAARRPARQAASPAGSAPRATVGLAAVVGSPATSMRSFTATRGPVPAASSRTIHVDMPGAPYCLADQGLSRDPRGLSHPLRTLFTWSSP